MAEPNDQALDNKLAGLDDQLKPLEGEDEGKDESAEPAKDTEDNKEEEQTDETEESTDDGESTEASESEDDSETTDEGYTLDENDDEADDEETPTNSTQQPASQLTAEQQYIVDNLTPIKVRGDVGGKVQEFDVLTPDQLPAGFKFLDDRDMAQATKGFAMLESQAERLQGDYRNQETTKATQAFKEKEDAADRADAGKLQREGVIPKIKAQPNDRNFEKDPGAIAIQEVLDFKEKKNAQYMEEYNNGRPYKHIGFEEAYYMHQRENPKADPAQDKEDKERKAFANRTTSTRSTQSDSPGKARVHSGMTSRDLDTFLDNLDF